MILDAKSLKNLEGVHPHLVEMAHLAARRIGERDSSFIVGEGVRSLARQKKLVASGASQTLHSRHLKGKDGYGHAIDLHATVGGKVSWHWPLYYNIARVMRAVALEMQSPVTWGGVWDRKLKDLSEEIERDQADYVARRRKLGKRAFLDGPHYQLPDVEPWI